MKNKTRIGAFLFALLITLLAIQTTLIPAFAATTDGMTTNIPDTDIGGATGGLDTSDITLPESTRETDRVTGGTTGTPGTNAPGTSGDATTAVTDDGGSGIGWIGIIIVVAVVAAIIIVIVAMMPKKKDY